MRTNASIEQDLLLVGGGHAHVLAMRALAMQPLSGLRVTLVSPDPFTPYSGMLPGLLAGHYSFEEAHIDLPRLCQWAGARFFADRAVGIDADSNVLHTQQRGSLHYDLISIDIGSQPDLDSTPGAREFALPVKPVSSLWSRWQALQELNTGHELAIVGGGAGSVELALAIAYRFEKQQPKITVYTGNDKLLPGYTSSMRSRVLAAFDAMGVRLGTNHRVSMVDAEQLHFVDAPSVPYDTVLWCTAAAPANWIAASGLQTDDRGFLAVRDTLQSMAFDNIFGAGDIATQLNHPRPKAGVFAVRQGPVLARNLRLQAEKLRVASVGLASGKGAKRFSSSLRRHTPQRDFLSLLSLGSPNAVAQRNGLSVGGKWVWRWKDHIDRKFMRLFSDLPPMQTPTIAGASEQAPCGGCGAKIGGDILARSLDSLRSKYPKAINQNHLDDSSPVRANGEIVQSIDALRAVVDDPWRMGRIAAQHALSDLYACGAKAHSAQALVTLPFSGPAPLERDLRLALDGALSVFSAAECQLLGGHSMQGPEFQLGFAVNGVLHEGHAVAKNGAVVGDRLVLTKALGTGVLFAAHMQLQADGRDIESALLAMEQGNNAAAVIARQHGVRAMTDVTGFGLCGHLLEMLGDQLAATVRLADLPVLAGANNALESGIRSTMHAANVVSTAGRVITPPGAAAEVVFDPQTSGGLLLAVPAAEAEDVVAALRDAHCTAADIGDVVAREPNSSLQLRIEL